MNLSALQNKYEAQRAVLKNGMVLSGSVMIGVQPLTKPHQGLFDGSRDEDPGMKVLDSKIEPPQLPTGKVRVQAVHPLRLLHSADKCSVRQFTGLLL